MAIKVNQYHPTSSMNQSYDTTRLLDNPSEESFEDVLVLNQSALKAMTIDAMIAESATGSIKPDAVDAAAIMAFRSKLPDNIQAPIPTDTVKNDTPTKGDPDVKDSPEIKDDADSKDKVDYKDVDLDAVYNKGVLKCSDELNAYFLEAAEKYNVDVKLLKSIACAESNFRPDVTSKAGAMGIMQMMPGTAKECGVDDPYDPKQSIMGGAMYISKMLNKFDGNPSYALAAYNAGANNVQKYDGIPPFEETQNYVKKVMKYYNLE